MGTVEVQRAPMKTLATFLLLAAPAFGQIHVDATALPGGDGSSWSSAFNSLDDALSVATAGNRVWVADGLYMPTVERIPGSPRTATFAPRPGVRLFGGFRGDELTLADRAGLIRRTILDGDIGIPGVRTDNALNVVRLVGNGAFHVVDGFTIRGGYADGTSLDGRGAGIVCQIGTKTVSNCLFLDNHAFAGGAFYSMLSIVEMERCTFFRNEAEAHGGAVFATRRFSVTDSRFFGNTAGTRGGAIFANQGGDDTEGVPLTRFQNCLFHDNLANRGGAAYVAAPPNFITAGSVVWSSCTFFSNSSLTDGAAIAVHATPSNRLNVDLQNSILWRNRSVDGSTLSGDRTNYRNVRSCIIQGGWPGADNIDIDPRFVDPLARNLMLRPGSPAIDSGNNDLILRDSNDIDNDLDFLEPTPLDFGGFARRRDDPATPNTGQGTSPVTDRGAHEF